MNIVNHIFSTFYLAPLPDHLPYLLLPILMVPQDFSQVIDLLFASIPTNRWVTNLRLFYNTEHDYAL